jgi:sugar O-acyltransferase (sialic acid O-acetyltransferase NeuD family)
MIIIGSGGFAREALCWARDAGFHPKAFFQQEAYNGPTLPIPVITDLSDRRSEKFIVAVGDPATRIRLWGLALGFGLQPNRPIIHPNSTVGDEVEIDLGSIVCPGAIITSNVNIGRGVIINIGATVGHDCYIHDWVTVSPGANISGRCNVYEASYVGTNSAIREGVSVGRAAVLGMGAILTKDIPDGDTWVGNPARKLTPKVNKTC